METHRLIKQPADYSHVTETPGLLVTPEALAMMCTRYHIAGGFAAGKDVLEVACGSGQGLGYLAKRARIVVGCDRDEQLIRSAHAQYKGRIGAVCLDAQVLPFADATFDAIVFYEAIYYLQEPKTFLVECKRVLRADGEIIIATVNREWRDFNPSPLSFCYFSGRELLQLLSDVGFESDLYGLFPADVTSIRNAIVSLVRRTAVTLNLIPKTMKGKQLLKRLFLGELVPLPAEISDDIAPVCAPKAISLAEAARPIGNFKVLLTISHTKPIVDGDGHDDANSHS